MATFDEYMAQKQTQPAPAQGKSFENYMAEKPPPVEYTTGEAIGDVGTAGAEGLNLGSEFLADVGMFPTRMALRLNQGFAGVASPEPGKGAFKRFWEGVSKEPEIEGVTIGDVTKEMFNPEGLIDYDIPEGQGPDWLEPAKTAARFGGEAVTTAPLGAPKYLVNALKAAPFIAGGAGVGEAVGGDAGAITGSILGALSGDPKALLELAKAVGRGASNVGGGLTRAKAMLPGRQTQAPPSMADEKRALGELIRNVYPDDPNKVQQTIDSLYPRMKQAVENKELGTVGQIANDPGLLEMEKMAGGSGPNSIREIQSQLNLSNAKLEDAAMTPFAQTAPTGNTAAAARLPRGIAAETAMLERQTADTVRDTAAAPFAGTAGIADESAGLAQTLGKKRDEVKAAAGKMFKDLPVGERGVSSKSVRKRYKEFFKSKVDKKIFEKRFPSTSGLINGLPEGQVSIDNISDILSEFSQETVGKGIDPKFITGVQDALFSSLDDVVEGASDARKAASANYKQYMQQYGPKSPLGKALAGDAETVGQKLLPSKNTGVARLNDILETGDPASKQKAEDYLRTVFREEVLNKPNVTPAQIATFKRNYGQTLDMLPEGSTLRADVDKAENALGFANKAEDTAKAAEKSTLAKFGDTADTSDEVVKTLGKVLGSKGDRSKTLGELYSSTIDNPQAREDLRRAMVDEMMTRVVPDGKPTIDSLKKFGIERDLYEDAGVFTRKELDNIENGLFEGRKLFLGADRARLAKLPPVQRRVLETTAALAGAKVGAVSFGSPLIGAALGRKMAVDAVQSLTTDKAKRIAYEMSVNPEKFVEVFERLNSKTLTDSQLFDAMKKLINLGLTGAKPAAIEANAEE